MTRKEALSYAIDTESFLSGPISTLAPELLHAHFSGKRVLAVADQNTWSAAGEQFLEAASRSGIAVDEPYIFATSEPFEPDTDLVPDLRKRIRPAEHAVVAIGSGTLNDIVKVAAFEEGIRYMVVATAASVDGYTSPGASMIIDGFKQSLYCRAPIAVLADTEVISSAPGPMLSAGYGDLASKLTAGADWIVADELGIDTIDPVCKEMIQDDLLAWLEDPAGAKRGDRDTLDRVMYGLTLTGIGMKHLRRSRPASGAEHLMSHVWEMEHHTHDGKPVSHGFQVAVATLAITAFMEAIFADRPDDSTRGKRLESWPSWEDRERDIRETFGGFGGIDRIIEENRAKYLTREELETRYDCIVLSWDAMARRVSKRLVPYSELRRSFEEAGCPVCSSDISLEQSKLLDTYRTAGMLRNRYTVLDLAWECGMLERVTQALTGSSAYPV